MSTILMENDTLLKCEGMRILAENLGEVAAERFVALVNRERFDYTEWRRDLFKDLSLDDFCQKVQELTAQSQR